MMRMPRHRVGLATASEDEHVQVFEEYLQAYQEEQHAACEFRLAAELSSGLRADEHSEQRDEEGGHPDERDGKPRLQKRAMVGIIKCGTVYAKCTPTRDKLHKRGVKPRIQRDEL